MESLTVLLFLDEGVHVVHRGLDVVPTQEVALGFPKEALLF